MAFNIPSFLPSCSFVPSGSTAYCPAKLTSQYLAKGVVCLIVCTLYPGHVQRVEVETHFRVGEGPGKVQIMATSSTTNHRNHGLNGSRAKGDRFTNEASDPAGSTSLL